METKVEESVVSLGDRMKQYEKASRGFIDNKLPVIIRLMGINFRSLPRDLKSHMKNGFMKLWSKLQIN